MGHFSTILSRSSRKHGEKRPRCEDTTNTEARGSSPDEVGIFSIDVGSSRPFKVRVKDVVAFMLISDGPNKVCLKARFNDRRDDEMVCLKWSRSKSSAVLPDMLASQIASSEVSTPRYRYRSLFMHQGIYICLSIRSYIPGKSLDRVISTMTENQISSIEMQVSGVVWGIARKVSPHFGHLRSTGLRTSTAPTYIRSLAFADTMTGSMDATSWCEVGNDSYTGTAVFCHGSLTPDHIIVDGASLVGVVGWSSADFMPEAYSRLRHYFMSTHGEPLCWNRRMCNISTSLSTISPSVEFAMNATSYAYRSAWSNASNSRRNELNRLWADVRTNYKIIPSISLAVEMESDNMSLSSLTSWTETTQGTYVGISER